MPKYLVISYDDDEQQTFYDHVIAKDEDEAKTQINDLRPYAIAICGIPPEEMISMSQKLQEASEGAIAHSLEEIADEAGDDLEFLEDDDRPGWHRKSYGLVYKSEPERHCPCGDLDCSVCGGNADWKPGMPYVR